MEALTVAVILTALVALVNLLFTVGVTRRLREHARLLADPDGELVAPVGSAVGRFTAASVDGDPVRGPASTDATLVGFFTPGCTPCSERLPEFVRSATGWPAGRGSVLAVVVGDPDGAAGYVASLTPVARVVVEPADGPVARAFQVQGFPAFVTVDRTGTVVSHGLDSTVAARA
jgi:hypothetical protein